MTVNKVVIMVDIALGSLPRSACPFGDLNMDDKVTVDEIVVAVNNALTRCP